MRLPIQIDYLKKDDEEDVLSFNSSPYEWLDPYQVVWYEIFGRQNICDCTAKRFQGFAVTT